jgi:hypothetical protein
MTDDEVALRLRIVTMLPELNERQRRLYLASEAKSLGYGGVTRVSRISGISRVTINQGLNEIEDTTAQENEILRCRRRGGGRKSAEVKQPGMKKALQDMVEAHTKGDPTALLIWTSKSVRNLSAALKARGYTASHVQVSTMLKGMGYTLQADRKDITISARHPERNAQFEYINEQAKVFFLKGVPVSTRKRRKR